MCKVSQSIATDSYSLTSVTWIVYQDTKVLLCRNVNAVSPSRSKQQTLQICSGSIESRSNALNSRDVARGEI